MSPWRPADWPAPPGVQAFATCRHGLGVSQPPFDTFNLGNHRSPGGDSPDAVARNRALLAEHAALPSPPHWLRQVHGTRVLRFDAPATPRDAEPEADAAVTSTPGVVLAVLSADCLPVLMCADDGGEVAAAHAGWRGLAEGVLEATLAAMHTPAARVLAWLGPAAGPAHYEVGMDVYDAFVARDWGAASAFASTRPLHWRVDLYALARRRLQAAGLRARSISGGTECTISMPERYFSHRRDARTGRMASLVWTAR